MTVDFSLIRSLAPCISGITLVGQRSFTSRSLAPRSSIWFEQFAHGLARVIDLLIGYVMGSLKWTQVMEQDVGSVMNTA